MRLFITLSCLFLLSALPGCHRSKPAGQLPTASAKPTAVQFIDGRYVLLRHGQPYFIRGVGGSGHLERLRACGGNSVRTWDDIDVGQVLDQAQRLGLTVMLGLWVEREKDGFDYNDRPAVEKQAERIRQTVLRYKNHPALLMWCVGNEWAQDATNFDVFDEVNRLAAMVHDLDPNHPTTTAISPDSGRSIWLVKERCPAIDILSVNAYGIIPRLQQFLDEGGWTGPYIVSEFGAEGYWETDMTSWGIPIEKNSTQKEAFVRQTYRQYIAARPAQCLGSYLFVWGYKQEETHTWFSFFDAQGRESSLVGLAQELWTGRLPVNRAPVVGKLLIDGADVTSVLLANEPGMHRAQLLATDPEGDPLTYHWEIKPAAHRVSDYIDTPVPPIDGLISAADQSTIQFTLPNKSGAYRLFVSVYDNHRHVASANLSFYVGTPSVASQ